jgi:hypothetical protein
LRWLQAVKDVNLASKILLIGTIATILACGAVAAVMLARLPG